MEEETQNQEEELDINSQETEDESQEEESNVDWQAEALKYKSMYLRHKNKETKQAPTNQQTNTVKQPTTVDRDELFFIAQGGTKEELEQLQKIVRATGVPIEEAKNDPLFVAYKAQKAEEKRKEKATLNASKGSSSRTDTGFEGLTPEEFKKKWKERNGVR